MGVSTPSPFTMDSDAEEERQLLSVFSAEDVAPLLNSLFDFRYQAPCVKLDEDKTIVDLVDKLTSHERIVASSVQGIHQRTLF